MTVNPLAGKPLRYLIGADSAGEGHPDVITMAPYGMPPAQQGISIGYCNLFDEENGGKYGPYLHSSDTAEEYDEGQIDPRGAGWLKNLGDQFEQRKRQGFEYIELDNPDAYDVAWVLDAINIAAKFGLKVIAKNPLEMDGIVAARAYLRHPNIYGAIVEKGCGNPRDMDALRISAGKPSLPVWFVAFGKGKQWANDTSKRAASYRSMGVTYSSDGEYRNSRDVPVPR